MAKSVMVIGGTGNIGSAVVKQLLEEGYDVSVFARHGVKPPCGRFRMVVGDRHDREKFVETMRAGKYDCVIDLSAFTVEDVQDDVRAFPEVERLVFCSTGAVYGQLRASELPIRENYRASRPQWSYGINKRQAEEYLMEQYYAYGYPVTILRPSITYGHGNGLTRQICGDNSWLSRIRAGLPIITGNPHIVRNFLHADDAARAFSGVLKYDICVGQQYNVVGMHPNTWEEYHRAAMKAFGVETELVEMTLDTMLAMQGEGFSVNETFVQSFAYNGYYSGEKIARDVPEFRQTISLEQGVAMAVRELDEKGLIPVITQPSYEDEMIAMQKRFYQTAKREATE